MFKLFKSTKHIKKYQSIKFKKTLRDQINILFERYLTEFERYYLQYYNNIFNLIRGNIFIIIIIISKTYIILIQSLEQH